MSYPDLTSVSCLLATAGSISNEYPDLTQQGQSRMSYPDLMCLLATSRVGSRTSHPSFYGLWYKGSPIPRLQQKAGSVSSELPKLLKQQGQIPHEATQAPVVKGT